MPLRMDLNGNLFKLDDGTLWREEETRTIFGKTFTNGQTRTFEPTFYISDSESSFWSLNEGDGRLLNRALRTTGDSYSFQFFWMKNDGSLSFSLSMVNILTGTVYSPSTLNIVGVASKWRDASEFVVAYAPQIDPGNWTTSTGVTLASGETITWAKNGTDTDVMVVW